MNAPLPTWPAPLLPGSAPRSAVSPRRVRLGTAMERLLERVERVFAVALLLVFSGAVVPLLRSAAGAETNLQEGDPHRQATLFALFSAAALLSLLRPGVIRAAVFRSPLTLGLVGFALASYLWSQAPDLTLRRGVALAGTTLCGLWLAGRFRPRELLVLLGWALGAAAVLSLFFGVALPGLGIHAEGEHAGLWRGVFLEKNSLGKMMVLGSLVFAVLALGRAGRARGVCLALAALSGALVLLSGSTTSLLILGALLALVPVYRSLAARSPWLVPTAILVAFPIVAALLAVAADPAAALGLFGKETTLTGRTELWSYALATLGERPLHGFGYGAFWQVSAPAEAIYAAIGWDAWHAHNGLLELGLGLGVAGVVLFLAGYLSAVHRGTAALLAGAQEEGLWVLGYLTFMLLGNLTESSILEQSVYWILYVATACLASSLPARAARREARGRAGRVVSPGVRHSARRRERALATGEG